MSTENLARALRRVLLPGTLLAFATPLVHAVPGGFPVLPGAGETVSWTLADSPVTISGSLTVPTGGTVLVEPGVVVSFAASSRLYVDGTLSAAGTPGSPVRIIGSPSGWLVTRGTVQLFHCNVDNTVAQGTDGLLHVADSVMGPGSWTVTDLISGPVRAIFERTVVETPYFLLAGEILLRDVTFTGLQVDLGGYVRLDNVSSIGAPVRLWRELQPMRVEGLSVSGVAGPGLRLDGDTDYLIDPSVSLSGNDYPVQIQGAGLMRGSVLPRAGNTNDAVLGFEGNRVHKGRFTMPDLGLPYVFLEGADIGGHLTVEPGVTIRFGPSGRLLFYGDFFRNGESLRGLPGKPITLEWLTPGLNWLALAGAGGNYLFEHLNIEGATLGISAPQSVIWLNESTVRSCVTGAEPSGLGHIYSGGVRWLDNEVGARGDMSIVSSGGLTLDGFDRPNVFAGNGIAVKKGNLNSGVIPARGNWWNHASGPFQATTNPGGQGDPVDFNVDYSSWLAATPDLSDTPPWIRADEPFFLADPGDPLLLLWEAGDDVEIVSQDILLDVKGGGTFDFQPIALGLPGSARQFAFEMPDPGFNVFARPALLRIVATDSAGQTSFDELTLHVSSAPYAGTFSLSTDLSGTFEPLERFPVCWSAFGVTNSPLRVYLLLDGDERMDLGPAGWAGDSCTFSDLIIPYVSTDSARLAILSDGNGNEDEWYFSDEFTIRPAPFFGDAPPQVQLVVPTGGEVLDAGSTLSVVWQASDDEGLGGFKVQTSLNGGRTWQTLVRDLPPTVTSYDWTLPAGLSVADARVRVVAFDRHFQNSSDGTDVSFSIGHRPGRVERAPRRLR